MNDVTSFMLCGALAAGLTFGAWSAKAGPPPSRCRLPMTFEANQGQVDPAVKFLARGSGYAVFLTPQEMVFDLRRAIPDSAPTRPGHDHHPAPPPPADVLRLRLAGAATAPAVLAEDPLPGQVSYLRGQDPARWLTGLPACGRVRYREVYPGIDLVFYGNERQLEFDFLVEPGRDPAAIGLTIEGASSLQVADTGELVLRLRGGEVRWLRPVVYQSRHGARVEVAGGFVLRGPNEVGFRIAAYDPDQPLVIDPVMVYGTYLGGNALDAAGDGLVRGGQALAVDGSGNVYLTGETDAPNFPTRTPFQGTLRGSNDVFVTKLNSNGTALVFSTYLGGNGTEVGVSLAVDRNGSAYVAGWTTSADFPTRNAFQTSLASGTDAFLARLGPAGTNLIYSTYFGGSGYDRANGVAVDAIGTAYLVGETDSGPGFPQKNPWQNSGGYLDAFVARFNTASSGNSSLVWSSWLGGADDERATAVVLDPATNVCVVGEVLSADGLTASFPVVNARQPVYGGGFVDGFVTKVNPATRTVLFSTYLGGEYEDSPLGLAVDAAGNYWITGTTSSTNFPVTTNAAQTEIAGLVISDYDYDAFVTKLSPTGSNLLYSTFLGGELEDVAVGVAVDASGHVYVTGETASELFPATAGADQVFHGGGAYDAFALKFNPAVRGPPALIYATYLGGGREDFSRGLAVDGSLHFYVAGLTSSSNDFPTTAGSVQPAFGGGFEDAFVARFASPADLSVTAFAAPNPLLLNSNVTLTVDVHNNSLATFTGVALTNSLPPGVSFVSVSSTAGSCGHSAGTVSCVFGVISSNAGARVTLVLTAGLPGILTNVFALTAAESEVNPGNNVVTNLIRVRGVTDVAVTQTVSPDPVPATSNLLYTLTVANKGLQPAADVVVTNRLPASVVFLWYTNSQGECYWLSNTVVCLLGTLPAGSNAIVRLVAIAPAAGLLTNVATVSSFEFDPNAANDVSSLVTAVAPVADLVLQMSASPASVFVGSNLTFTLAVTNQGPSSAAALSVTNPLPPGVTFVSATSTRGSCATNAARQVVCGPVTLDAGAGQTVTLVIRPTVPGLLTNTAEVAATAFDPDLSNNAAGVVRPAYAPADLALALTASPNPVGLGGVLSYRLTVTNLGPNRAGDVVVTNELPATVALVSAQPSQGACTAAAGQVRCDLQDLNASASATVVIEVTPTSAEPVVIRNTARAAHPADPNATNNLATILSKVAVPPTVTLTWHTNAARLTFGTQTGLTYFSESKYSLGDPNWAPLATNAGAGGPQQVNDPLVQASNKLYRVRVAP